MVNEDSINISKSEIIAAISESGSIKDKTSVDLKQATGMFEKAKDNIAWLLGLPPPRLTTSRRTCSSPQ